MISRMHNTLISTALLAIICASSLPLAVHAADAKSAIDFRQSAMKIYKWYLGPMAGMVKEKSPYDAAGFRSNAAGLAKAASLDLTAGFPANTFSDSEDDTDAKPEIRENWEDFTSKYEAFREASEKLMAVSIGGDLAAMKQQFAAAAKTCKGCHDDYREK